MDIEKLKKLVEDDDLGLLAIKAKVSYSQTDDERLVDSFYQVSEFTQKYGREPGENLKDIQELKLAKRLKAIRENPEKVKALINLDEQDLLKTPLQVIEESKPIESIKDIFEDDDFGLLGIAPEIDIYNLTHVSKTIDMPEEIARRKKCEDFEDFELLFKQCHADLKTKKRVAIEFANEQQIEKGQFFILKGVVVYIADVGKREKKEGKYNARMRCIFENGTESNLLLRSLSRELYRNGRRVTQNEDRLMDDLKNITLEDEESGFIYILKSLSKDAQISEIPDLYKIGFSRVPVAERIKNAEENPTYLMAKVKIVETFKCYNLNPQKLELLLHKFLAKVCLELDVYDNNGKRHTPREWFSAPLPVIEEAIELMISGDILNFRYDEELQIIKKR